jgi:hypothetical protein
MKREKFYLKFLLLTFCFFPLLIFAQPQFQISYPQLPQVSAPVFGTQPQHLANYIRYIFYFSIFVGIILSLFIFVFGGFRYLYSGGNPQIVAQAKSQMLNAFLGLTLLLVSLSILNSISPEFSQIEPTPLNRLRLIINTLRVFRFNLPWQTIVQQILPTTLPFEVTYPTIEGFRPSFIPFETTIAPTLYPLHRLLAQYVKYIYDFSLIVGTILAFLFLILGGIKWQSSGGNVERIAEAKEQIFASLLGLLLLFGSYLILRGYQPEYTRIAPAELPDVELELEPGVYLCRQPMNPNVNDDPVVRVLRCGDLKTLAKTYNTRWPVPNCLFSRRLAKEIVTFIQTQCLLVQTSYTLPPWFIGEPVDIDKIREQLESVSSTLSEQERQEIINEWEAYNQNPFNIQDFYIYINGSFGLVLHQERDFKGRGEIILKHNLSDYYPPATYIGAQNVTSYRYRFQPAIRFRSITLFEDRVMECILKTRSIAAGFELNISECLDIEEDMTLSWIEDLSFAFYNIPDFGALEEKIEEVKELVSWVDLRSGHPIGTNGPPLFPIGDYGLSPLPGHWPPRATGTLDSNHDPVYSLKLPSEENWVVVVGAARGWGRPIYSTSLPIYVFDKSQRNFEATYVGSFCEQRGERVPCITHFFAWPGKILKEKK